MNSCNNEAFSIEICSQKLYPYFLCLKKVPEHVVEEYLDHVDAALDNIFNIKISGEQAYTFQRCIFEYNDHLKDERNSILTNNNNGQSFSGYTAIEDFDLLTLECVAIEASGDYSDFEATEVVDGADMEGDEVRAFVQLTMLDLCDNDYGNELPEHSALDSPPQDNSKLIYSWEDSFGEGPTAKKIRSWKFRKKRENSTTMDRTTCYRCVVHSTLGLRCDGRESETLIASLST